MWVTSRSATTCAAVTLPIEIELHVGDGVRARTRAAAQGVLVVFDQHDPLAAVTFQRIDEGADHAARAALQMDRCAVIAHGNGGVLSSQCTVIFGGASTV